MRKLLIAVSLVLAFVGIALLVGHVQANSFPDVSFEHEAVSISENSGGVDLNDSLSASSPLPAPPDSQTIAASAGTGESRLLVADSPQSAALRPYPTTITLTGDVDTHVVLLPLVMKRCPPIPDTPVLNAIHNPDGDGYYAVSWGAAYLADTYVLQEDDNAAFSSPTQRYSGSGTSWNASGKSPGTYYYRVKAVNAWGDSGWSNTEQVTVSPPMASVSVQNDTGGTLCYEIDGTGIGERCYSSGTHFYGSFPAGTYTWHASARCGSAGGTKYYGAGKYTHRFWCE
ncbi:MAG: hypothetical protein ACP5JG_06550 [Anaerolineae bacterium]